MKRAEIEPKKIVKSTKKRHVAGVQVRSGVKAGRHYGEFGGPRGGFHDLEI